MRMNRVFRTVCCLIATLFIPHVATSEEQEVYPAALQTTQPLELGELILLLMPDKGTKSVGWAHRSESSIIWQTQGYETARWADGTTHSLREGIVRVNILGRKSTVLRKRLSEFGWTVKYSSTTNPKFGPEEISIAPGIPSETCFGTNYDGCDFETPLGSLAAAGIVSTEICKSGPGPEPIAAYLLTHPDHRPTVLVWKESGGSGGTSAWIELKLTTKPSPSLCIPSFTPSTIQPSSSATTQAPPPAAQLGSSPRGTGGPTPAAQRAIGEGALMIGAVVVVLAALYFLPTIVAVARGRHNKGAIFVLNLFLGWTLIGWVISLVWAVSTPRDPVVVVQPPAQA